MPRHRLVLILACILGLAVTAGLAWRAGVFKSQASAAVGGPFQLVNQDGVPTAEKALKGSEYKALTEIMDKVIGEFAQGFSAQPAQKAKAS